MSYPAPPPPEWAVPAAPRGPASPAPRAGQLRTIAAIVLVMAGAGTLLGLVWQWWSPGGPAAYVIAPGLIQPDETEAFVAGDGRYGVIVLASGVLAALILWFGRVLRGAPAVVALSVGGLAGAALTAVIGNVTSSGTDTGKTNTVISELPLSVHAHGLLLVEAGAALFVYGLCLCFARDDNLDEPDPLRELARASVRPDVQLQYAGGDGDGPGGVEQRDLPPQ